MDTIVDRLRTHCACNCNIETTPCMAEDACRATMEAADEIERLEAQIRSLGGQLHKEGRDRV